MGQGCVAQLAHCSWNSVRATHHPWSDTLAYQQLPAVEKRRPLIFVRKVPMQVRDTLFDAGLKTLC